MPLILQVKTARRNLESMLKKMESGVEKADALVQHKMISSSLLLLGKLVPPFRYVFGCISCDFLCACEYIMYTDACARARESVNIHTQTQRHAESCVGRHKWLMPFKLC